MGSRLHFRCRGCGKPLRDSFSTTIGIGPICRMNAKLEEYHNRSVDLFHHADRADYSFTIEDGIVCVVDRNSGRSVTNDADAVVEHIVRHYREHFPGTIIYRDLDGIWDQMVVQAYRFAGFRALSTKNLDVAKQTVGRKLTPALV